MTIKQQLSHILTHGQTWGRGNDFLAKVILYWIEFVLKAGLFGRGLFTNDMGTYNVLLPCRDNEYHRFLIKCGVVSAEKDTPDEEIEDPYYLLDLDEDFEVMRFMDSLRA